MSVWGLVYPLGPIEELFRGGDDFARLNPGETAKIAWGARPLVAGTAFEPRHLDCER